MKVLWITNFPVAAGEEKFNIKLTSNTWVKPTLLEMKNRDEIELSVASVARIKKPESFEDDGVKYYFVPAAKGVIYDYNSKVNQNYWKQIIEEVSPEIIMIWGTEYSHGLCALKVAGNIPSVIMIQGILDTVAKNYFGGMTQKEIRSAITLRNIIKRDTLYQQQQSYIKRAVYEKEMITISGNVMIENDWSSCHCREIFEGVKTHYCPLNIDASFFERCWNWDSCERYSVFCSAPGYPLKGLHNLLRAIALVKRKYPQVKLYVPGMSDPFNQKSFSLHFKRQGYTKFLMKLITRLDIKENVCFLGRLTSKQMSEYIEKVNVFTVPSCIENHSATLREAMTVGTPSVSSYVGGIPEVVKQGENGFLYRFEEYAQLADYIEKLFENRTLAEKLSTTAKPRINELEDVVKSVDIMINIYKKLLD